MSHVASSSSAPSPQPLQKSVRWVIRHRPLIAGISVFLLIVIGGFFIFSVKLQDRFFPHVRVGTVALSGLTKTEGRKQLEQTLRILEEAGLSFDFKGEKIVLPFQSDSPDLAADLVWFDVDATLDAAFRVGREPKLLDRGRSWLTMFSNTEPLLLAVKLDEKRLENDLTEQLKKEIVEAKNARFVLSSVERLGTEPGEQGIGLDFDLITRTLNTELRQGVAPVVSLILGPIDPKIREEDLRGLLPEVSVLLERMPTHIRYQTLHWQPTRQELVSWLSVSKISSQPRLSFGSEALEAFFLNMERSVNTEPKEPKFEIQDGKVKEFQIAEPGRQLQRSASAAQWTYDFILHAGNESTILVDVLAPKITKENVPMLGIEEIIGMGESDFTGSPTNRRHNIRVGADRIHGTLIAPDEEFSLLSVLGDFGPEDGWLPELVIKENKTIPEFGGGACQFGTTMFRGALNVGLPITERRNHSYTVSYYYPIGTDATIYDPAPDFRFLNDTGNYILIQAKIDGNKLQFEFWGKKDGRSAIQTSPVLTNWIAPPETKLIESTDIPVGERKCIERAHKGVSASFDYHVTYVDGRANDQTFASKYKPWQEVCLVGVEKLSTPPAPSTP